MFITYFIQPLAESLSTYFKDTTHFRNLLQSLRISSRNCIFSTYRGNRLKHKFPQKEGIDLVKCYTEQIPLSSRMKNCPSTVSIISETFLTNSTFQFSSEFFHQTMGTSMGHTDGTTLRQSVYGKVTKKFPQFILFF